jgi:hypothetical protein
MAIESVLVTTEWQRRTEDEWQFQCGTMTIPAAAVTHLMRSPIVDTHDEREQLLRVMPSS